MFDARWDMERTFEPVVFGGEIDWLYQPGNDPEWIFALNRMRFWITLGQAYALTGDEKYAEAFAGQMTSWIKRVKKEDSKNAQAWRSIEAGIRLENWIKAVAYFKGSPALTADAMELFNASVTEHAEFIMGIWNTFNLMSNWGVMANHGLFIAGVYLGRDGRPGEYIAEALKRLAAEARIQVYRDGAHWEQSPMYHNEVLHCYLDVMLLAGRNNITLPRIIVDNVYKMALYSAYAAKPDHNEIAMGDSDRIDQRDLLSMAAYLFNDGFLKSRGYGGPDFDTLWDMGFDGFLEYNAMIPAAAPETDMACSDSGNYYFRDSWGDNATFLHFHCGTLGAGHGHTDKLHFDLFSRGEDVLVDAGRFTYVFGGGREEFKELQAHNAIKVDGREIYPQKDSWECFELARPVNRQFYSDARYGYAEGGHTGYMDIGVFVNRRLIYIKPDIIVVADEFYAQGHHEYERFFHFNSAGSLTGAGDSYIYKSGKLRANVKFIGGGVTNIVDSRMSRMYNQQEDNKAVIVTTKHTGFGSNYAVVAISDAGQDIPLHVTKLPVVSKFKDTTFGDDVIEALNIQFGTKDYVLVIAHKEYATPTDVFSAGEFVGFGNAVIFDRAVDGSEGTVLLY
jgi:hypothetical protein